MARQDQGSSSSGDGGAPKEALVVHDGRGALSRDVPAPEKGLEAQGSGEKKALARELREKAYDLLNLAETLDPTPVPAGMTLVRNRALKPRAVVDEKRIQGTSTEFVQVFNAVFKRKVGLTPRVQERIADRLKRGYKTWELMAVPILVDGREMPADLRKSLTPEILLRDGKHPHTYNGQTSGSTDWVERELMQLDRAVLTERLWKIAEEARIGAYLRNAGVGRITGA